MAHRNEYEMVYGFKVSGYNVEVDNEYRDHLDERNNYKKFLARVFVKYQGKEYELEYSDEYEDQNGGSGAHLITKKVDDDLSDALESYVEDLGDAGEFAE